MVSAFTIIKSAWNSVGGSGHYLGIFLIACMLLYIRKEKYFKELFAYSILVLLLFFNPLLAMPMIAVFFGQYGYWHLALLLPVVPVCAYVILHLIISCRKIEGKRIVVLLLMVLFLFPALLMTNQSQRSKKETDAYIKQELVDIFEATPYTERRVVLLGDDEVMEAARAYSQQIELPYEVPMMNDDLKEVEKRYEPSLIAVHQNLQKEDSLLYIGAIASIAREYECNYIVLPWDEISRYDLAYGGYEIILETEHYILYHDTQLGF